MREIIENHWYSDRLAGLGNIQRLDDALAGAMWAIARAPIEEFPIVQGTTAMRLLKTEALIVRGQRVYLRIWFTYLNDHQAELLHIDVMKLP